MSFRHLIILSITALLLTACGGSRKAQIPPTPKPGWAESRPTSPTYYYGIGIARKTSDINQYQQAARQNALADLAGEISINISSNSVIHSFESNLNFSEDFTSTIKAQTQQELEGYELVDTWDDLTNYWVFYRLSRAQHQELTARRKSNAITQSLGYYSSAIDAKERGNIRIGVVQLIKALEPILPYFGDPLPAEFRGESIFLGNRIFKELSSTLSSLEIRSTNPSISVKTGQSISSSQLQFETYYSTAVSAADIPLIVDYSERPIRNNRSRTNREGIASFDIDIVRSSRTFETVTATIDMSDMLAEATGNTTIRRLISRFNLPMATCRINIEKPTMFINSTESNLGTTLNPGPLFESTRKKAIEMGYHVTNSEPEADYIVQIVATTSTRDGSGQFKSASLTGSISVETSTGNQLYHKPLEGFTGRHFELVKAGEDAFRDASRRVEITFFREIHEAINRR